MARTTSEHGDAGAHAAQV